MAHLHLEVIVQAEVDGGGLPSTWSPEEVVVSEAGIDLLTSTTILVHIVERLIVPPHGCAEVWGIADPDTRCHTMADHLDLVPEELPRLVETIEGRIEARRGVEVKDTVEAILSLIDRSITRGVVVLAGLVGVPPLVVVGAQCEVDIVEDLVGGRDGDIVGEGILPVTDEVGLEEAVLLRRDAVAELPRVA